MITKWGDEVSEEDKTVEECAELIHILQKVKRFGIDNTQPHTGVRNRDALHAEIRDVQECLYLLMEKYDYKI